jgi:GntR family transcriptional regulator
VRRNGKTETVAFAFRLDAHSGVPVYRQLIDQVQAAIAAGVLVVGDQLPTVRQVAVDLVINPNTVLRAYREMEIRGTLDTQQGSGTFIADKKIQYSKVEHERQLGQLVGEFVSRAGSAGFTVEQLIKALRELSSESEPKRR